MNVKDKQSCFLDDYLSKQIITYIGNKRALLPYIENVILKIKQRLNKSRLITMDLFSGSGIVARLLKQHSSEIVVNDIENYSYVINECYLSNKSSIDLIELNDIVFELNSSVETCGYPSGFIEKLYAPRNENCITKSDRVFYTKRNAKRIDNYRRMIEIIDEKYHSLLLAPLLSEASIHVNTSGVFKGFYKNRFTNIGQYGGTNSNSLKRIISPICLDLPVLSDYECDYKIYQNDANKLVKELNNFDVVYIDPPYNQHPYGSNYFMLNLIVDYNYPFNISKVSGIPVNWKRSAYNSKFKYKESFVNLIDSIDSKFLIISFNNEGFLSYNDIINILEKYGNVETFEIKYNTFRGSRNLKNRSIHVLEFIFLLEKK